jgi:predicted DNA-binding protein
MSQPVCLRLPPEIYSALARLNKQSGEKTISHTIRRLIADGLNDRTAEVHYAELIERLNRIESQTSILEKIDLY